MRWYLNFRAKMRHFWAIYTHCVIPRNWPFPVFPKDKITAMTQQRKWEERERERKKRPTFIFVATICHTTPHQARNARVFSHKKWKHLWCDLIFINHQCCQMVKSSEKNSSNIWPLSYITPFLAFFHHSFPYLVWCCHSNSFDKVKTFGNIFRYCQSLTLQFTPSEQKSACLSFTQKVALLFIKKVVKNGSPSLFNFQAKRFWDLWFALTSLGTWTGNKGPWKMGLPKMVHWLHFGNFTHEHIILVTGFENKKFYVMKEKYPNFKWLLGLWE